MGNTDHHLQSVGCAVLYVRTYINCLLFKRYLIKAYIHIGDNYLILMLYCMLSVCNYFETRKYGSKASVIVNTIHRPLDSVLVWCCICAYDNSS